MEKIELFRYLIITSRSDCLKRILFFICLVIIVLFGTSNVEASNVEVKVGGKEIAFEGALPYIDSSNRTMVPVRFIVEEFGATVEWDAVLREVHIFSGTDTITLKIDSDIIRVNGIEKKMDTKAVILNDRTYVPLRFVTENLGKEIIWERNAAGVMVIDILINQIDIDSIAKKLLEDIEKAFKDLDSKALSNIILTYDSEYDEITFPLLRDIDYSEKAMKVELSLINTEKITDEEFLITMNVKELNQAKLELLSSEVLIELLSDKEKAKEIAKLMRTDDSEIILFLMLLEATCKHPKFNEIETIEYNYTTSLIKVNGVWYLEEFQRYSFSDMTTIEEIYEVVGFKTYAEHIINTYIILAVSNTLYHDDVNDELIEELSDVISQAKGLIIEQFVVHFELNSWDDLDSVQINSPLYEDIVDALLGLFLR